MPAPAEPWLRMQSALSAFAEDEITTRELAGAAGFTDADMVGKRLYVIAGMVLRANGWTARRLGAGDRPRVYSRPLARAA